MEYCMSYKVHAGSNTELIQKRLFEYGYKWMRGDEIVLENAVYLHINEMEKEIMYFPFLNDFIDNKNQELTLTEFLKIFPEKKQLSDHNIKKCPFCGSYEKIILKIYFMKN